LFRAKGAGMEIGAERIDHVEGFLNGDYLVLFLRYEYISTPFYMLLFSMICSVKDATALV
jgi:hypothetical protein